MKCQNCPAEITLNTRSGLCKTCRRRQNQADWRHSHPEKDQTNTKRYRKLNPDKAKEIRKQYAQNNLELVRKQKASYAKTRMRTDIQYRLKQRLRTRLWNACHNKCGSAVQELGCSVEELKTYLESKFEPDMTWDNWGSGHGKWQIDHIEPLYKFDLTNLEQLRKASHFSNLRPYWFRDHIEKTKQENIDAKSSV